MARFASASAIALLLLATVVNAQTPPAPTAGAACALDGSSANIAFSTTSTQRIITTNFCPNHAIRTINPNQAKQNSWFGVTNQQYALPLKPQLASTANIINVTCVGGPIGFMRSGAVIYSCFAGMYCGDDAVVLESFTFDECGGHSDQSNVYHYHMTPSCTLLSAGYVSTAHSPILGYMIDGIPLYGPLSDNGALPTDLDSCGGHSSDSGNNGQYHYHTKPVNGTWPDPSTPTTSTPNGKGRAYMPACLRGCVDLPYLHQVSNYAAYTSYSACTSTGGTILTNVESITSATAGPATPSPPTTTGAPGSTTKAPTPTTATPGSTTTPSSPKATPSPSSSSAYNFLAAIIVALAAMIVM